MSGLLLLLLLTHLSSMKLPLHCSSLIHSHSVPSLFPPRWQQASSCIHSFLISPIPSSKSSRCLHPDASTLPKMASPPKEPQLKAGHPPAVKAGGKRIVQKHVPSVPPAPPTPSSDDEEYVTEAPPKLPMVVSGVVTKGDKDFTPQAAQVAHQKPLPKTEKHYSITQQKMPIHQPRK